MTLRLISACSLAFALLVTATSASAAVDCKNASDQTSLNICAGQDYKASDKKLNASYNQLLKQTSEHGKPLLQKAQRAWLIYRDAQCEYLTSSTTPYSAQPMLHLMCLDRLTQEQTKLLDEQLHCEEGDIGCGQQ
ncbi:MULTISPECIES: lysozyme inhibitor LprI family protein [Silvimonas]|uniref:lysozyme inhibitor LprI family protein n=1 Tax=Silvimonas TaxID=300264 RepID=UPI0024B3BCC9|nr:MULTISPECIES: lysozyme inhibitor LprI family protein [Silvimonas]MDR3430207.1 lysozyme inhibitor LprI family protein [Silvimonas sp.]